MARLIYIASTSLDGYIEDPRGDFDWPGLSAEVHQCVNDIIRPAGTFLYGRRMYETMAAWQTIGTDPENTPPPESELHEATVDFGEIWRGADKVVYSRTLDEVPTPRTRLEQEFDAEAVRRLKEASARDIGIGGPGIAQRAFEAGLVDDIHVFVFPVVTGGGKPGLARDVRIDLELVDVRPFDSGVVHLHHRPR